MNNLLKYDVRILDYSGRHIYSFDSRNAVSIEYERKYNDIGSFSVALIDKQAEWATKNLLLPTGLDYFAEIYRLNPRTKIREKEGTYFVRLVNPYYPDSKSLYVIVGGHSLEHLLLRRLIIPSVGDVRYDPYASAGYITDAGQSSRVISRLVDVHLGEQAIDERRIPNLTVIDGRGGGQVGGRWRFDSLFEEVKKMADAEQVQFSIDRITGNELVCSVGKTFKDLTVDTNYPGSPMTLLKRSRGTLYEPSITLDHQEEKNRVYVRGSGNEENQTVIVEDYTRLDTSPYNLIEFTHSPNRDEEDSPTILLTEARDSLYENRPNIEITFPMKDVPGAQYKTDFDLGDIVTISEGILTRDVRVTGVSVSVEQGSDEVSIITNVEDTSI